MQRSNFSTVGLRYLFMYSFLGLSFATCVADAGDMIILTLQAARPELSMGEPLLLDLTVANSTNGEIKIRTDGDAPIRFILAPDGTRTELVPLAPAGAALYFYKKIPMGSLDTLRFIVPEIAHLKKSGRYRLILEYEDLHASGELQFVIKP